MSLVLQVNLRIKPGKVDSFMTQVREIAKAVRSEPGCRQFDVLVNPDDDTDVMLFEVYDDQKAFDAHQASAGLKQSLASLSPLLAGRGRRLWRNPD